MTVSITNNSEYLRILNDIKSRIRSARIKATHKVNRELIDLYWNIGKIIVEKQAQLGWGKAIVETLSKDIRKEFPGISGYSPDNLWRMRQFYLEYSDNRIMEPVVPELTQLLKRVGKTTKKHFSFLEQLVPEIPDAVGCQTKKEWALKVLKQIVAGIPWGHNLVIMKKVKDIHARLYYIFSSARCGWSRDVLLNQIKADAYSRHCFENKQHNFPETLPSHLAEQADEAVKDSYMLDFLGITKPGYAGKMNFYLNLLDDYIREDDENPSIGIILCAERDRLEVEYALRGIDKPVGVAEYRLTKELPTELRANLPSVETIKAELLKEMKKENG
jgi:predicted nuclease of restriction endonuclease-like (RecB) superfamily